MNEFTLKYGGASVKFAKSEAQIAVRASSGAESQIQGKVLRSNGVTTGQRLHGFDVATVSGGMENLESTLDQLREDPEVEAGTHVFHTSNDNVPFVPTGEIFVQFKPSLSLGGQHRLIDKFFLEVADVREDSEVVLKTTLRSPNPLKVAAALQATAGVQVAEPELATPARLYNFVLPSDNLLQNQWHLRNTGILNGSRLGLKAGADARVVDAWNHLKSFGSRDIIVSVIDDGFDLSHPDLSGPGKVVAPWDFTRNGSDPRPGNPFFDSTNRRWTGDWHGTACAGVAIGNAQGQGIVGAAPGCRLMPIRWGVNLADSQIEAWFNHATAQGASVVSCSWGAAARVFPLSSRAFQAIRRCAQRGRNGRGCVVVFAAGNENSNINDPNNSERNPAGGYLGGFATHPDVVAVSACTSRDERSHYSCYGDAISVSAPSSGAGGRGIVTSDVIGTFTAGGQVIESGYSPGAFTNTFGGTSSATPLVAGVAALLLSTKPSLTSREVKALLEKTSRRIGPASGYNASGHSKQFGFGCVNALAAIRAAAGPSGASRASDSSNPKANSRRANVKR